VDIANPACPLKRDASGVAQAAVALVKYLVVQTCILRHGRRPTCRPLAIQMIEEDDWRIRTQANYLTGIKLTHGPYVCEAENGTTTIANSVGPRS
jgi:hypothetical protein